METTTLMKRYLGIKSVLAEPMNEREAVKLGYARPNEDEHEWREGYHVLYEDGYHSWSPKGVFQKNYKIFNSPRDRMIQESAELSARIFALRIFLEEHSESLTKDILSLMRKQLEAMTSYAKALDSRIELMRNCDNI